MIDNNLLTISIDCLLVNINELFLEFCLQRLSVLVASSALLLLLSHPFFLVFKFLFQLQNLILLTQRELSGPIELILQRLIFLFYFL